MIDLGTELQKEVVKIFVQKGIETTLELLGQFAHKIRGKGVPVSQDGKIDLETSYPSVCLLGVGRCGSNIAVGVSALVYNVQEQQKAKSEDASREGVALSTDVQTLPERRVLWWERAYERFSQPGPRATDPKGNLFLAEPIVFVGDLNKNIKDYFGASVYRTVIDRYSRLIVLNFEAYQKTGAGNHPILGQYLANMLLVKDPQKAMSEGWQLYHNYLIDSVGLPVNPTKLFFYIFSAGGGTGAGMASEFAAAQQTAFRERIIERKKSIPGSQTQENKKAELKAMGLDFVFCAGIAVLPYGTNKDDRLNSINHTNAGRVLVRYLSQLWLAQNGSAGTLSEKPIRSFDCLILISNDIMRYAIGSDSDQGIDVVEAEELSNNYISQQIFNILTAQAPTTDYDPEYITSSGIDMGETIQLDPMDLNNSLSGPVVVAYAETSVNSSANQKVRVDGRDMLRRAIALPNFNQSVRAIEGISVLPFDAEKYRSLLETKSTTKFDFTTLRAISVFRRCPAVVVVISLPVRFKLQFLELEDLKAGIAELFPECVTPRYSIVIGASRNVSLTLLISQSAILAREPMRLINQFIKFSLGRVEHKNNEDLEEALFQFVNAKSEISEAASLLRTFEERVVLLLNEDEDPSRITQKPWDETAGVFERKWHDLVPEYDPPLRLDSLRVELSEVINAMKYIRQIKVYTKTVVKPRDYGYEND